MVDALSEEINVDRDRLLDEFQEVHQQHGNSEHPFAIFEIASVRERMGHLSRREKFEALAEPLSAFRDARNRYLELYPSVQGTLETLVKEGVVVVGHTEALAVQAASRLRRLGVIDYFDHLYAIDHEGIEPHPKPDRMRNGRYEEIITYVPPEERKPNPELLFDICDKEDVDPSEALYVGNSIPKDIAMAKEAGIPSVWARYGRNYDDSLWELLVRITHWTDEDVKREERIRERFSDVEPDATIDRFEDILSVWPVISDATKRGVG
jgi:phosphoglycolate phosphatase